MKKPRLHTAEEYAQIANAINDGSFFEEGRKWYSLIYMYFMPERCIYIIYCALAFISMCMIFLALIMLQPLAPTVPLLFPMKNVLADVPRIKKLRVSPHQEVNDALQRFFIREYVSRRENYSFDKIQTSFRFLRNHSSESVMNDYRALIDPNSPRSPINMYERKSTRRIYFQNVVIRRADNGNINDYSKDRDYYADVFYAAYVTTGDKIETTNWHSQINFNYKQLQVTQPEDLEHEKPKVTPMKFTATDYSVTDAEEDEYKQNR